MAIKKQGGTSDDGNKQEQGEQLDFAAMKDGGVADELADGVGGAASVVTSITRKEDERTSALEQVRRDVKDIVARARAIYAQELINFRDVKITGGATPVTSPLLSDLNILTAFAALFGEDGVYFDTFRARTIAWNGDPIDDDLDLMPLLEALTALKLPQPSWDKVETLLKKYARKRRINTLTNNVNSRLAALPWDGVSRLDESLIKLFDSKDTQLTREFSRYFWLSLYARCMTPGWNAPVVLTLIGQQGAGKSYFGKLICEELMGDPTADVVPFDLSMDFNDFLRTITGRSLIANVAEMSGYNRGDLNKIKSFVTKTSDQFHHKWENVQQQLRQWIMVMDGNSYLGLQRDDTGNRRFYPICVGFLGFKADGDFLYRKDFEVDFSTFRDDIWMYMAECRAWFESHGDEQTAAKAYHALVSALIKKVHAFSLEEMRNDRGTIRDDGLDMFLIPALRTVNVELRLRKSGAGRPTAKYGAFVSMSDVYVALSRVSDRSIRAVPSHIKPKLTALGGVEEQINSVRGFLFPKIESVEDWEILLGIRESPDDDVQITRPYGDAKNDRGNVGGF